VETKKEIMKLIEQYYQESFKEKEFKPGESPVAVSGKVFDETELKYLVEVSLDGWFTTGRFNQKFEDKLAKIIGTEHVLTTNSGSSANLLAIAALTTDDLKERKLNPGDEVIAVASAFPTTVNPLLTYGLVPVFVDIEIPTYNIEVAKIEQAVTSKTKAVFIAHTLGNPFNLKEVKTLCEKYNLWLVEDCCDALGSKYDGKHVGTVGDLGTLSFYPAHHITTGEGGAVFTNNKKFKQIVESLRDWGRDCWCEPGCDNSCERRFSWKFEGLPESYDHKYVYSRQGYNLKMTDMQAALGLAQLEKLPAFIEIRKKNFSLLYQGLSKFKDLLILPEPQADSDPSWFGFLITVKKDCGISRQKVIEELENRKIGTRLLFAGDIRKQPYFENKLYRNAGDTPNTDLVITNTFWIGVAPLLSEEMIKFIIKSFEEIFMNCLVVHN